MPCRPEVDERTGPPDGRKKASALLEKLAALAVERGCDRIEWIVLDSSESAIQFYRSLEASPLADWTIFRLAGEPFALVEGLNMSCETP